MQAAAIVSVLCSLFVFLSGCSPRPGYNFEKVYEGRPPRPISFDRPITCNANLKVEAGYVQRHWIKDPNVFSHVDVIMQAAPTIWKVIVHGQTADVTVSGGDYKFIQTDIWEVGSQTEDVLVLLRKEKGIGAISTLTIDAKFGTFILCFNASLLGEANGATVHWGRCSD